MADDMGLDASTCNAVGNQQAKMLSIQAMCDSGLVFDNAYSAPICTPTRATVMTGQYSFRTGSGGAIPLDGTNGLSADVPSLSDVLKDTGYSTNLIGKWHLVGADASATDGIDFAPVLTGGPPSRPYLCRTFLGLRAQSPRCLWLGASDGRPQAGRGRGRRTDAL